MSANCCFAHGAASAATSSSYASLVSMYQEGAQLVSGGQPVAGGKVDFSQFAPTQALDALSAQRPIATRCPTTGASVQPTVMKLSILKLCKQHGTGQCKLGAMCRNVHICPQAMKPQQPARCDSASRGGVKLPPIPLSQPKMNSVVRVSGSMNIALPAVVVPAPERSCSSPVKSARSARLSGVDASKLKPTPPMEDRNSVAADLEDVVLVSTPVPTPPPRGLSPRPMMPSQTSTGSGCFRRFARRWNEPLKNSGAATSQVVSSAGNSIDMDAVRCNVDILEIRESKPTPPTNASGEGRCFARKSAFDTNEGFFSICGN